MKVIACEWNRHAVKALKVNLRANGVADRCTVLFGDSRRIAPEGVADRVILGLLPSSKGGWKTALTCLKATGGWLHLHENVTDRDEESWMQDTLNELRTMSVEMQRNWSISVEHREHVKWYAPHIRHVVLDIRCQVPTANTDLPSSSPKANSISIIDAPSADRFWAEIVAKRRPVLIQRTSPLPRRSCLERGRAVCQIWMWGVLSVSGLLTI